MQRSSGCATKYPLVEKIYFLPILAPLPSSQNHTTPMHGVAEKLQLKVTSCCRILTFGRNFHLISPLSEVCFKLHSKPYRGKGKHVGMDPFTRLPKPHECQI